MTDKRPPIPDEPRNNKQKLFDTDRLDVVDARGIKFLDPNFDHAAFFDIFSLGTLQKMSGKSMQRFRITTSVDVTHMEHSGK